MPQSTNGGRTSAAQRRAAEAASRPLPVRVWRYLTHYRRRQYWFVASFLAGPLLIYGVFVVSPYLQAFQISLTDWQGYSREYSYVGLRNYRDLLDDDLFWRAVQHNLYLLIVLPLVTIGLALFFTSMLNVGGRKGRSAVQGVRGSVFYKTVYFLPHLLSVTVVAALWYYIYYPRGPINEFLRVLGLGSLGRSWLTEPDFALTALLFVLVWSAVGFYVVLFNAAIQQVPREIYESALIDGAGRWAIFRRVTVPLLWDSIQVAWIFLSIIAIDAFALAAVLTPDGGPDFATLVVGQHMYNTAFAGYSQFGYASAIGVVAFFFTLTIAVLFMRVSRRERIEY